MLKKITRRDDWKKAVFQVVVRYQAIWYPAFVIVGKDSHDAWTLKPFIRSVFKYDSAAVKLHSPVGMSRQKTPNRGCMLCSKAHCVKAKLTTEHA